MVAGLLIAAVFVSAPGAQAPSDARRKAYDEILDVNVRDGMVYYRALRAERGRLDGYLGSLASVAIDNAPRNEQIAFWINAYNAIVLETVVDHYPIATRTKEYPQRSIRQIPGAFERLQHRIGGRMVTLDQIEQNVLSAFRDPRIYLALGRGALGSGRLRSEAYTPEGLEQQLAEMAAECGMRTECLNIDQPQNRVNVSSIFSWREADFIAAFADKAPPAFGARSPIERAVIAFIHPHLLFSEQDLLEKNQFKMEYVPFDWSLNDLTGRGGR